MTIVVTGSAAFDYIMSYPGYFRDQILPDHLDKLSVSFLVTHKESHRGGCGPNIAYSLALLGNRPKLLASAGHDFVDFQAWLETQGVDTSAMGIFAEEFTATFTVLTDLNQSQIAGFHAGAMSRARELSLRKLDGQIDMVIISPNDPQAMRQYAQECRELSIPFVYDPSQQMPWLDGPTLVESMSGARALTVNEYEFEMARHKTGLDENGMLALVETIVVTRGAAGSSVIGRGFRVDVPAAAAARMADPTGVGDAYRAGLLTGMVRGYPWEVTGRLGSLAAAYVVENNGTMNHRYALAEFVDRFRREFGDAPELADLLAGREPVASEPVAGEQWVVNSG